MTDTILPDDGRPLPARPIAEEPIPLPSDPEMIEALDNQRGAEARGGAEARRAAPAKAVRELDFVDDGRRTIVLKRPFRLDGRVVDAITVRRLGVAEVGRLNATDDLDRYDFYGAMTGLPPDVLRGLDYDDMAVIEAAYDFLPRFMTGDD